MGRFVTKMPLGPAVDPAFDDYYLNLTISLVLLLRHQLKRRTKGVAGA